MDAATVDGGMRLRTERAVDAEGQQNNSADDDAFSVLARAGQASKCSDAAYKEENACGCGMQGRYQPGRLS